MSKERVWPHARSIEWLGLMEHSDKFCNAVIRDAIGIDPENQSQTKSAGRMTQDLAINSCLTVF